MHDHFWGMFGRKMERKKTAHKATINMKATTFGINSPTGQGQ